jgi:hypothetical protein
MAQRLLGDLNDDLLAFLKKVADGRAGGAFGPAFGSGLGSARLGGRPGRGLLGADFGRLGVGKARSVAGERAAVAIVPAPPAPGSAGDAVGIARALFAQSGGQTGGNANGLGAFLDGNGFFERSVLQRTGAGGFEVFGFGLGVGRFGGVGGDDVDVFGGVGFGFDGFDGLGGERGFDGGGSGGQFLSHTVSYCLIGLAWQANRLPHQRRFGFGFGFGDCFGLRLGVGWGLEGFLYLDLFLVGERLDGRVFAGGVGAVLGKGLTGEDQKIGGVGCIGGRRLGLEDRFGVELDFGDRVGAGRVELRIGQATATALLAAAAASTASSAAVVVTARRHGRRGGHWSELFHHGRGGVQGRLAGGSLFDARFGRSGDGRRWRRAVELEDFLLNAGYDLVVFLVVLEKIRDVEKRVAFQADIDESRLHARQDARNPAFVNAAGQGIFLFALIVNFGY